MADELRLDLLGTPLVTRDGIPLTGFIYQKSLGLLVYLAVTGQPHSRGTLAGLLWPESTEANARSNLRKVLSDLRRQVPFHLIIARQEVAFDRASDYWLDVEAFGRRANQALVFRDSPVTAEGAAALAEVIELYRGDFMEGFAAHNAPSFEQWLLLEREHLRLLALRVLDALVEHRASQGTYAQTLDYAGRLLALEPAHEETHRRKMSLLARSGQRAAALHQYQVCCQALAALGAEPDVESVALYRRILAGRTARVPSRAAPHRLPVPLTPLVGREPELAGIRARLEDPACRLLTLVGIGGAGKTRLSQAVVQPLSEKSLPGDVPPGDVPADARTSRFDDGICFVPLVSVPTVDVLAPTLTQSLGVPPSCGDSPLRRLLDFVRGKRLLLVLDGFEHLLAGADLLVDLLGTAPGLKILVTSRVRLNIEGEHLFPIQGLDFPAYPIHPAVPQGAQAQKRQSQGWRASWDGETLAAFPAVELFISSARQVHPGFQVTERDLADVARICHLVGGLPLGILLAAGWVRMLTPGQIAARLCGEGGQGLELLETEWRYLPARQRSMRIVFEHSWHLLTERQRTVMQALSVFRGGFSQEAAQAVAGASLHDLKELVERSLVQGPQHGRYVVHDLLRHFVEEKLKTAPDAAEFVHQRHSTYFLTVLEQWWADLKGPGQHAALVELETDLGNVRAAWKSAAQQEQNLQFGQALNALCYFFKWRGCYEEGNEICQMLIDGLAETGATFSKVPFMVGPQQADRSTQVLGMLARAWAWQGVFHYQLGHKERADRLLRQSLGLLADPAASQAGDLRSVRAFVLWRQGKMLWEMASAQAAPLFGRALALYRDLDDPWAMANVLEDLSWVVRYQGNFDQAHELSEESLTLRQALGDQRGISHSLKQLSAIAYRQGRLDEAERLIRDSCTILLDTGSRAEQANSLSGSGWILTMLGRFEEGASRLGQSVAIWEDLGLDHRAAFLEVPLAFARMHLSGNGDARTRVPRSCGIAFELDERGRMGFTLFLQGWLSLAQKALGQAREALQKSLSLMETLEERDQIGEVHAVLAYVALGMGRPDQARQHLCQALQTAATLDAFLPALVALPAMALFLADLGDPERAVDLYTLASRYAFVSKSHWFADTVGCRIDAIAAGLPPDVVAKVRGRGRARDLDATVAELVAELEGRRVD